MAERTKKTKRETLGPTRDNGAPTGLPGPDIPIQIFLTDEAAAKAVEESLLAVLSEAGVTIAFRAGPLIGSWYRGFRGFLTRASHSGTAAEARRAIEIQLLDRFQAGIDGTTGDAVAKLITALGNTSGAVIQVGSVLLVKLDDTIVVRQLSQREMAYWQRNPGLFKSPVDALAKLQHAMDTCDEPSLKERQMLSGG